MSGKQDTEVSPTMLHWMRCWVADCEWLDDCDVEDFTDAEIVAGVERHYEGGVAQFAADLSS